jgi:alpha-tubulin suppressor-like RCC1 family protein
VESTLSFYLVSFFSFKNFIANNEVYVTGLNDYGQLGISRLECRQEFFPRLLSQQPEEIKSIKTGIFHSLLLSCKLI